MCAVPSTPLMGILIGAFAGGIWFLRFGLTRAVHAGGFSVVVILSSLKGRPVEQSPFVRIMVAAGIIVSVVLGIGVAMILGGIAGGVIEHALMKMKWN